MTTDPSPSVPVESREQRWADTLIEACRSDDEQVIVLAHWIASVLIGEADDEQEQLRAERDRARDLAAHLAAALQDFADHGLRADLTPTINCATVATTYEHFRSYLVRLDEHVRSAAASALAAHLEAEQAERMGE